MKPLVLMFRLPRFNNLTFLPSLIAVLTFPCHQIQFTTEICHVETINSQGTPETNDGCQHQQGGPAADLAERGVAEVEQTTHTSFCTSTLPVMSQLRQSGHKLLSNIRNGYQFDASEQPSFPDFTDPGHELQFLSVSEDAGFIPTSAVSALATLPWPSMPLDPFHADWPHWGTAADHHPHPPLAPPFPH
jgi:hypothetical protein